MRFIGTLVRPAKLENPGDTVLAHAGVYFEHVTLERGGDRQQRSAALQRQGARHPGGQRIDGCAAS